MLVVLEPNLAKVQMMFKYTSQFDCLCWSIHLFLELSPATSKQKQNNTSKAYRT
jgi:hypothetical protein